MKYKTAKVLAFWLLCGLFGLMLGALGVALTATGAHAQEKTETEKAARELKEMLCFMSTKAAHDTYLRIAFDAQRVNPERLHFMVDYDIDMGRHETRTDRTRVHSAAQYIYERLKNAGVRRVQKEIVYEAAGEYMRGNCYE